MASAVCVTKPPKLPQMSTPAAQQAAMFMYSGRRLSVTSDAAMAQKTDIAVSPTISPTLPRSCSTR